jgi:uncharacterized membrane protein
MMATIARETETNRTEAFSDGVFAIAITLLVLEIQVPHTLVETRGLARALLAQWPSYLAFVTSFVTIGIMWLNHHRLFTFIGRSDHTLQLLNLLLLLGITFLPFPTSVLADHLGGPNGRIAAFFYSATFFVIAVAFNAMWRYAATDWRLIADDVDRVVIASQTRQYMFGPLFYAFAAGVAFLHSGASVAVNLLLALFFAIPPRRVSKVET